jgi:hypothetical protein
MKSVGTIETIFPIEDKATNIEFNRVHRLYKIPIGIVVEFYGAKEDIPDGWLWLDSSWYDIADYRGIYNLLKKNGKITTETIKSFKMPSATGKIIKV